MAERAPGPQGQVAVCGVGEGGWGWEGGVYADCCGVSFDLSGLFHTLCLPLREKGEIGYAKLEYLIGSTDRETVRWLSRLRVFENRYKNLAARSIIVP